MTVRFLAFHAPYSNIKVELAFSDSRANSRDVSASSALQCWSHRFPLSIRTPDKRLTINHVDHFEPSHPYVDKPLIVVSGIGRSGTTAMTAALAAQPEIDSTNRESNLIRDLLFAARRGATMPSRQKQMIVQPARYNAIFRRTVLELLWPLGAMVVRECRAISTYFGLQVEEAAFLAELFPRHLVVYLVRNGIEVVASRMQHRTFKQHSFEAHCLLWNETVAMAKWAEQSEHCLICRHEHFQNRPSMQAALGPGLERYGITNLEPMLEFLERDPKHTTSVPGEADEALAARNQRWKYWTGEQQAQFADLCGDSMAHFGYPIPWEA